MHTQRKQQRNVKNLSGILFRTLSSNIQRLSIFSKKIKYVLMFNKTGSKYGF